MKIILREQVVESFHHPERYVSGEKLPTGIQLTVHRIDIENDVQILSPFGGRIFYLHPQDFKKYVRERIIKILE